VTRAVGSLPFDAVLDGEIVCLDDQARPNFQRLQKRFQLLRPADIAHASVELPGTLFVFDLLGFEDFDLRGLPLATRKGLLAKLLPAPGVLRYVDHVDERGVDMYEAVRQMGLEGIVGKRADSLYKPGRKTRDWVKIRVDRHGDFVVVGYTRAKGQRVGFGALHIAVRDPTGEGELCYAGRVGTGFSDKEIADFCRELDAAAVKTPPCRGRLPAGAGHVWSSP